MQLQRINEPRVEGYKGIFKGFSENNQVGVGKKTPVLSFQQKAHHFEIGVPSLQQPYITMKNTYHDEKTISKEKIEVKKQNQSKVEIGYSHYKVSKDQHFKSETGLSFQGKQNSQPPVRAIDKTKLLESQIFLGADSTKYQTFNQLNYGDNLKLNTLDIKYKTKPPPYNLITGENYDIQRLKKTCAYPYWQKETTNTQYSNQTNLRPERFDPITGRKLI